MARIDGSDRMRLPADSGIRTTAYSAREHAASGPAREAVGDWMQVLQRGAQGQTRGHENTEPLGRAIEQVIQRSAPRSGEQPASLPLTVIKALEAGPQGNLYQVQLGSEQLMLRSQARLEPGQTLTLVPNGNRAEVVAPQSNGERLLVLQVAQRQQWAQLAAAETRTGLRDLIPWIRQGPTGNPPPPGAAAPTQAFPAASGSTGQTAGPGSVGQQTPAAALWVVRTLPSLLNLWVQQLPSPQALNGRTEASGDARMSAAGVAGVPVAASSGATDHAARLQQSQHWIAQLVQSARREYGEATPQTVRQVWQGWQQSARSIISNWQSPDFSQVQLTPARSGISPPAPLITALPMASAPAPFGTAETGQTTTPIAERLAEQLPLLQSTHVGTRTAPAAADRGPRDPAGVPSDLWRLLAAQLIDQRFQQAGLRSAVPSLQEQLQRRAELALQATQTTYSPANIRRLLQAGGAATPQSGNNTEQQSLLQVRQLLEQFSQQQTTRLLQTPLAEPGSEQRSLQQAIPVLQGDQVMWFEVHRESNDGEQSDGTEGGPEKHAIDLHFHLPPMAPVCARLSWQGTEKMAVTFLTDDTPTLRLFHNQLETLNRQFERLALPVDQVRCRHGLPKRVENPGVPGGGDTHIDVHT